MLVTPFILSSRERESHSLNPHRGGEGGRGVPLSLYAKVQERESLVEDCEVFKIHANLFVDYN